MPTSITELNISECAGLTERSIAGIATRCVHLSHFTACGLSLTDAAISNFVVEPVKGEPRGENLMFCNLGYNTSITDAGVESLVKSTKQLEVLNLSGCIQITDEAIRQICLHANHVKILGLGLCKRLTDR